MLHKLARRRGVGFQYEAGLGKGSHGRVWLGTASTTLKDTDKAEVPKPSHHRRGQKLVPVPLWIVGKLALYWTIREIGISQSELARRRKVRETAVRRMLDPNHDTRPERLQAALEALGKRVVMAYADAA
jgi:antitoxin HicB